MNTYCHSCGHEAPTRKVMFVQHIGAVVMFFHKRIGGEFCRNCVGKYFGEYTVITLFLGWWGLVSVLVTPIVLLINIANYFRAWSLAPVPPHARRLFDPDRPHENVHSGDEWSAAEKEQFKRLMEEQRKP